MFHGQYEHALDEKGRLTIPARYRELLGEGGYVTRGLDGNLMAMPASVYTKKSEALASTHYTSLESRMLRRQLFGGAVVVEFDRNGRFLVPAFLREYAGLDGSAVLIGAGEYFEIWSPERWAAQEALMLDPAMLERYAQADLPV
ncbi:MAG TPA: division/cell wall cluster transcriptional repressor MraZ [Anaerolineaceae bacterium]|nr:division/cell wall cluster transcriptional repressor MraZ [Anaerolineaceae bacterium]HPN51481.1 division/cell wall cluster transcriptional repressor MraZ [Anaerolineaceae bacterium]